MACLGFLINVIYIKLCIFIIYREKIKDLSLPFTSDCCGLSHTNTIPQLDNVFPTASYKSQHWVIISYYQFVQLLKKSWKTAKNVWENLGKTDLWPDSVQRLKMVQVHRRGWMIVKDVHSKNLKVLWTS